MLAINEVKWEVFCLFMVIFSETLLSQKILDKNNGSEDNSAWG